MTNCNCDDRTQDVAKWISKTYRGGTSIIGMIATDSARENAAKAIMGSYGTTSKKLDGLLAAFGDTVELRLSALRQACLHLAHSDEYRPRVAHHLEQRERRAEASDRTLAGALA